MKILFIGHSWISYLENNFNKDRHNPNNNDIKFKRIRLSRFEDLPSELERELRPDITHVMVSSIFRQAYYRLQFTCQIKPHKYAKEYSVTFPDTSFRAEDSLPIINQMLLRIKNICPRAKLYILIPTFPDLYYYNVHRNIEFAPAEVKNWYHSLPRSSARHVNEDTHFVYQELMKLHSPTIKWSGKHTLALSEVLYLMGNSIRRNYEHLMDPNTDVYSLGHTGPLVDGIHPTTEFMEAFWKLLHNYSIFEEDTKDLPNRHYQIPPLLTIKTKQNETPRPKLIPREQVSGEHKKNKYDQHFRFSHMTSHSTSSLPERDLPSTSSGISNSDRNFNAHPTWTPKKRCSSPSSHSGSKRLQSSIALPRPIQRMTLEQIDLVQGQFNIFAAYMMGVTHLNTPNVNQTEYDATNCTS
ncbi:hypothetical protein Avbf_03237 [Armadillidium vulgare]|nr:hypothetical protein Avbf_03237 [Armadillidium vulgare]